MKISKPRFSDRVRIFFSQMIHHPDLELGDFGILKIRRSDVRADEMATREFSEFDFSKFTLPPNSAYLETTDILERDDLICTTLLVVNNFMYGVSSAKNRHDRARSQIKVCIRFFEYIWMRDFHRLQDIDRNITKKFAEDITKEGWIGALCIASRVKRLHLSGRLNECIATSSTSRADLQRMLGTNIEGSDFGLIYQHATRICAKSSLTEVQDVAYDMMTAPIGFSTLRQVLSCINKLHDAGETHGLNFLPYPNAFKLARALSPAGGRTKNIGPDSAAKIFSGSFKLLFEEADETVRLASQIADSVIKNSKLSKFSLGCEIPKISSKFNLSALPTKRYINGDHVRAQILLVMSACFVILAVCNARRRDEIQHRKFGLYYGCATIVNQELDLYASEFYIQKTILDYSIFYINKISFKAIKTLEQLQEVYDRVDEALGRSRTGLPRRERSLFSYRRLSEFEGIGAEYCWFNFDSRARGYVRDFLNHLFPEGHSIDISAHMFRRLYGLLFMYRHEIPDVQALSFQYAHDRLSSTFTYITDPEVESDLTSIFSLYGSNTEVVDKAYKLHCEDMQETLREVSRERIKELVSYVVDEKECSGGFTKFLRNVYKRYMKMADFQQLTAHEKCDVLARRVIERGHLPNPFRHSICVASTTRGNRAAKCRSSDGMLSPELSSPKMCNGCAYQYMSQAHIANMQEDAVILSTTIDEQSPGSISRQRYQRELDNLLEILKYHSNRLRK